MSRNHRSHYLGAEEKARIEIIPMIDIMMFLLVFFMLATLKMIQGAGIKLDLPQSSTAEQLQQTIKVSIGVTKTDELYLDARPITPDELTTQLKSLVGDSKKVDVAISGDEGTSYKNIIHVMDLVRAAGISSVALATNPTT
jgi:biopolymer transport protein ExbD